MDEKGHQEKILDYQDEKVIECKEMFDSFDKDRDGSITVKEMGEVLRALGGNPTVQELTEMVNTAGGAESGVIKFEQFYEIFQKKMKEADSDEDLISAFKIFDKDADGWISCDELKLIMTSLGERIGEEKADEMLKEADPKGLGKINYHDLVNYLSEK